MESRFNEVVNKLERLQIMPKTMPGLEKISKALAHFDWFGKLDPNRIIVVAGTNGKGSTCAALEALLLEAGQKVGLYTSPHLISTNERIRVNGRDVEKETFVEIFRLCEEVILLEKLTHFEAMTLMMAHYFFDPRWSLDLDFIILEVGLGGKFDATNAFPHKFNIITKLGMDHTNILGDSIEKIAENKFGIVGKKSIVIHQKLPVETLDLKVEITKKTNSNWIEVPSVKWKVEPYEDSVGLKPRYYVCYEGKWFETNLVGKRGAENSLAALIAFESLGFSGLEFSNALKKVNWRGRMQEATWPNLKARLYLSGDHNEQGVESLISILQDFSWNNLYLVVGIGVDKDAEQMLEKVSQLPRMKLCLTETPFKGRKIHEYPNKAQESASIRNSDVKKVLDLISKEAGSQDLVVVTGSLYLVGKVLEIRKSVENGVGV